MERSRWGTDIMSMKGLNGLDSNNQIAADIADPVAVEKYRQFEKQRSYVYNTAATTRNKPDDELQATPGKDHGPSM